MVAAAAFPVVKLGILFVKQVAKPIAKNIAVRAKNSRIFREYVCIPIAQAFHWYEIKLKMMTMDLGVGGKKITKVPKLNEAKAIEQGSEILSEFIILSIASALLIFEYSRSKEKEDRKEEALSLERERIRNKVFELELKLEKQTTQIRELARSAIHLEEELHKRSLRRIFEQKPQINPGLLETAQEPEPEPEVAATAAPELQNAGPAAEATAATKTTPVEQPKEKSQITAATEEILSKTPPRTQALVQDKSEGRAS